MKNQKKTSFIVIDTDDASIEAFPTRTDAAEYIKDVVENEGIDECYADERFRVFEIVREHSFDVEVAGVTVEFVD